MLLMHLSRPWEDESMGDKGWGYRLGKLLSAFCVGAVIYGGYGAVYWVTTGRLYFGPWEWGLCFITALYMSLIQRSSQREKEREDRIIGYKRRA